MKKAFTPASKPRPSTPPTEAALIIPQYEGAQYTLGYIPLNRIENIHQKPNNWTEITMHSGAKIDTGMSFDSVMRLKKLAECQNALVDFRDVEGLVFHKYMKDTLGELNAQPRFGTESVGTIALTAALKHGVPS